MSDYKLLPGPVLERKTWVYDDTANKGEWVTTVVTDRAVEFLFHEVEVDPTVTLQDLFKLIGTDATLRQVFRQEFVNELCAEVEKGAIVEEDTKAQSIEYLELYQVWNMDSDTKECFSVGRFQLHGIGPVLTEDVTEDGSDYVYHHKGERINWGVSLTPVRELLPLPIRINFEVKICEDNLDAKAHGHVIQSLQNNRITLGTFIREVLWELSWHGGPEDSAEVSDSLKEQVNEIKAGTAVTRSCDDVFESLGFTPQKLINEHFFIDGLNCDRSEVYRATHNLEDHLLAKEELKKELDGRLVLKPEHGHLTGKELRKAMREFRQYTLKDDPE